MAQSEIGVTLEKTVNHLVHSGIEMLEYIPTFRFPNELNDSPFFQAHHACVFHRWKFGAAL